MLEFGPLFKFQEILQDLCSNINFRENIYTIYINEIRFVVPEKWVTARLFHLENTKLLEEVYTAYRLAQVLRHSTNYARVLDNLIVCDYSYMDDIDFVKHLMVLHDGKENKLNDKVTHFLLFNHKYKSTYSAEDRNSTEQNTHVRVVILNQNGQINNPENKILYNTLGPMMKTQNMTSMTNEYIVYEGQTNELRENIVQKVVQVLGPKKVLEHEHGHCNHKVNVDV
jgi:phage anti-repressor protein